MAKLSIRSIRQTREGVFLEVKIQTRSGRIMHHTKSLPLPAGSHASVDLDAIGMREGARMVGLPGESVIVSVPSADLKRKSNA